MKRLLILCLIIPAVFTSCSYISGKRVRGNGNVKTDVRSLHSFTGVHVSGNMDVYVKQDSVFSVKVEADENLFEYILAEVDGSTLEIRSKNRINLKPSRSIKIFVSGPSFNNFEASGACDIFSENKITGKRGDYNSA